MRNPAPTLGERLRAARRARGWTQFELARKAGVSKPTVSRWETDDDHPSGTHLIALGGALGLPPGWWAAAKAAPRDDEQPDPREATLEAKRRAKRAKALARQLRDLAREIERFFPEDSSTSRWASLSRSGRPARRPSPRPSAW